MAISTELQFSILRIHFSPFSLIKSGLVLSLWRFPSVCLATDADGRYPSLLSANLIKLALGVRTFLFGYKIGEAIV